MTPERAVAVMAKKPTAGLTKTRLTPDLTPQQAAEVYECFLLDTIERLVVRPDCETVIAIDEPGSAEYFERVAPNVSQVVQVGDSLGQRLDTVLTELLSRYPQALAVNSDSPDLPDAHLTAAFAELSKPEVDVVIGPTHDGGYWLIGWKRRWSSVVTDVVMSTPEVLADTVEQARLAGATVSFAPPWSDVDDAADLERFVADIDPALTPRSAAWVDTFRQVPNDRT